MQSPFDLFLGKKSHSLLSFIRQQSQKRGERDTEKWKPINGENVPVAQRRQQQLHDA
jgi:hypothetical protein